MHYFKIITNCVHPTKSILHICATYVFDMDWKKNCLYYGKLIVRSQDVLYE